MSTQHNKLVRDKIIAIIETNGDKADYRILDDEEYLKELCRKLHEEAAEVTENPSLEELADTLEVIYAIGKRLNLTPEIIEKMRQEKAEKRGGFDDKIYLISTKPGSNASE